MSMFRRSCSALLLAGAALWSAGVNPASASTYTVAETTGNNWQTLYVQGFSTSVGAAPTPIANNGDEIDLSQFQFFKSGAVDTAANIQLAIFNTMYPDLSTQMTTTSASFVGLSTNTILSTAPLNLGDAETFTFNNLPLKYGNDYGAIFVNVSGTTLTPIRVSALAEDYSDDGTGNFFPVPNYGGTDNFTYATSNFINGNFFSAFSHGGDALFSAQLSTVPEPASLGILGLAAMFSLRRRSRKMD
jgi:hypothetical protein